MIFYLLFFIYNLIWLLSFIFFVPYYLLTGNKKILIDRFCLYNVDDTDFIWIHASSIGETKIAKKVIEEIRKKTFEPIILTVVTKTGFVLAQKNISSEQNITIKYAPFDFFPMILNWIDNLKIQKFISIETEIWPSYILALDKINVQKYIINARLSNKSFPKYQKLNNFLNAKFITKLLQKFNIIFTQSEENKKRFSKLEVNKKRIISLENLKYDLIEIANDIDYKKENFSILKPNFNKIKNKFISAGSIRNGEEEILIKTFSELKNKFKENFNLIFFIAPRHFKNISKIIKIVEKYNFKYILFSELKNIISKKQNNFDFNVIILDVFGELINIYKNSDIVFVGGSLINKGGQNIVEPVSLAKLTIFGKYMSNFQDITDKLLETDGAIQVKNEKELFEKLKFFLDDKNELEKNMIIHKGLQCLKSSQGATKKTINYIFSK